MIERRGPHAHAHIRSSLQLRNGQVIAHGELAQVAVSDIASVAVFLASDDSTWLTGDTIVASGGLR